MKKLFFILLTLGTLFSCTKNQDELLVNTESDEVIESRIEDKMNDLSKQMVAFIRNLPSEQLSTLIENNRLSLDKLEQLGFDVQSFKEEQKSVYYDFQKLSYSNNSDKIEKLIKDINTDDFPTNYATPCYDAYAAGHEAAAGALWVCVAYTGGAATPECGGAYAIAVGIIEWQYQRCMSRTYGEK